MSTDLAIRRQALRALLLGTAVLAVPTVGLGALLVGADLAERGEAWDGLGVLMGAALAVPSLVLGVLAWTAYRSVPRHLARARCLGGIAGGLLVLPLVRFGGHWTSWTAFFLGAALLAAAAVARDEPADSDR
jgi:hypothetical protein